MNYIFDHEKLTVYRQSINFIAWLSSFLAPLKGERNIKDQLDRASISISLNIAEGNAKFSLKDRYRYFETALASSMECAAGLDILVAKKQKSEEEVREGKILIHSIVSMLHGLRRSYGDTVRDESSDFYSSGIDEGLNGGDTDKDYDYE